MKYPFIRMLPARLRVPVAAGAAGALAVLGSLLAVPSAQAATSVTCDPQALSTALSGAATTGGTLSLASGCTYTLTAVNNTSEGATGLPVINGGNVTIQGNGATITRSAASGTPAFRLLAVGAGSLNLSSLTLSNGLADNTGLGGGAVYSAGPLTVSNSTLTGNSSPSTTGSSGGAINAASTLNVSGSTFTGNSGQEGGAILTQSTASISNSTFAQNTGQVYGGGALVAVLGTTTITGSTFAGNTTGPTGGGGAIDNDATVNISDSTFTGNTGATNGGGALQNFGTMSVGYTTLSGDSSPYGAEIHNYPPSGGGLTVSDSIVANGQAGSNCGGAAVTDGGYNLDSGTSCGFTATGSKSSANPALGPLASNGGPTQTMALPATSPAVDAIPAATPGCTGGTDQRGVTRPQGTGCDIGAYELVSTAPPPAGGAISGYAGKCVDNYHSSTSNGTIIDIYSCNGTNAQKWTFNSSGELVNTASGLCLNDSGYGGSGGKMIQWTCVGTSNETWTHTSGGHYVLKYNGLCLNDPGYSTTNGTQLIIWACGSYANENWSLPA